jgi:hypothetical protein
VFAFDNIYKVSVLQLRLVTCISIAFCALSLVMLLVVPTQKPSGNIGIAGWTTVVSNKQASKPAPPCRHNPRRCRRITLE